MRVYRLAKVMSLLVLGGSLIVLGGCWTVERSAKPEQRIGDEPWALVEDTGFVRTWLVCGVFPDSLPRVRLGTDYLTAHGGEEKIHPVAGMSHRRPDGTEAEWFEHTSSQDELDFVALFRERQTSNVVAYAYSTVKSRTAGKAVLALGSDDGVRIWLNGELVHDNPVGRAVRKDEDIVPVTLHKGDNALLAKVEQGPGDWGLVLRVLGETEGLPLEAEGKLRKNLMAFRGCQLRPQWGYMFAPGEFPAIVWDKPQIVEESVGDFPLEVRWFNDKLQEVTEADEAGRYLVYVQGQTPSGLKIHRALTLYCRPPEWRAWADFWAWGSNVKAHVEYPPNSPINEDAWNERDAMISSYAGSQFVEFLRTEQEGAILMAYLHEMKPLGREPLPTETPKIINNDLHLALKRRLLGVTDRYPPLQPPRKSDTQATVLRPGTAEEAGVKADAAERIRSVCTEWYEASKEPFAVLVARHGVIIIHEAFDEVPDGSVTIDTPLDMASITKAMTGMMFAQFLDQGLIGLDDPVGKYLPDFPVQGDKVITLRDCFTHTSGLDGHYLWGGVHNPWLDNVILIGVGCMRPERYHRYNGMGYDLAGKVMEVVSGKSILRLMHENFFEPLGVSKTRIDDLACATISSAEDIARMGQLLLNRGSYGDRVFFSPETFEELLPKQLGEYHPGLDVEWGTGLVWLRAKDPDAGKGDVREGKTLLSKNTIGHGAASSAILRVDLDNQIVVSQVRNIAGDKYGEYLTKFLKAIDDSIL